MYQNMWDYRKSASLCDTTRLEKFPMSALMHKPQRNEKMLLPIGIAVNEEGVPKILSVFSFKSLDGSGAKALNEFKVEYITPRPIIQIPSVQLLNTHATELQTLLNLNNNVLAYENFNTCDQTVNQINPENHKLQCDFNLSTNQAPCVANLQTKISPCANTISPVKTTQKSAIIWNKVAGSNNPPNFREPRYTFTITTADKPFTPSQDKVHKSADPVITSDLPVSKDKEQCTVKVKSEILDETCAVKVKNKILDETCVVKVKTEILDETWLPKKPVEMIVVDSDDDETRETLEDRLFKFDGPYELPDILEQIANEKYTSTNLETSMNEKLSNQINGCTVKTEKPLPAKKEADYTSPGAVGNLVKENRGPRVKFVPTKQQHTPWLTSKFTAYKKRKLSEDNDDIIHSCKKEKIGKTSNTVKYTFNISKMTPAEAWGEEIRKVEVANKTDISKRQVLQNKLSRKQTKEKIHEFLSISSSKQVLDKKPTIEQNQQVSNQTFKRTSNGKCGAETKITKRPAKSHATQKELLRKQLKEKQHRCASVISSKEATDQKSAKEKKQQIINQKVDKLANYVRQIRKSFPNEISRGGVPKTAPTKKTKTKQKDVETEKCNELLKENAQSAVTLSKHHIDENSSDKKDQSPQKQKFKVTVQKEIDLATKIFKRQQVSLSEPWDASLRQMISVNYNAIASPTKHNPKQWKLRKRDIIVLEKNASADDNILKKTTENSCSLENVLTPTQQMRGGMSLVERKRKKYEQKQHCKFVERKQEVEKRNKNVISASYPSKSKRESKDINKNYSSLQKEKETYRRQGGMVKLGTKNVNPNRPNTLPKPEKEVLTKQLSINLPSMSPVRRWIPSLAPSLSCSFKSLLSKDKVSQLREKWKKNKKNINDDINNIRNETVPSITKRNYFERETSINSTDSPVSSPTPDVKKESADSFRDTFFNEFNDFFSDH